MRRVELNADLSPHLWVILEHLLSLDQLYLKAAWKECNRADRGYAQFQTTYSNGKSRTIHIPSPTIKKVQVHILKHLLYQVSISRHAYGGVPKRSYLDAAQLHLKQPGHLLHLDIHNAFSSTTYVFIAQALRKSLKPMLWVFNLNRADRKVIIGWLTHLLVVSPQGGSFPSLPLGTPTSLATFNHVWAPIDSQIEGLYRRLMPNTEVRYSRYVDDLTFSCDRPLHPDLAPQIEFLLKEWNYTLNPKKQRVSQRDQAIVHGLKWQDGHLIHPPQVLVHLQKKIQHLSSQIQNSPTPQVWHEAQALHRDIQIMSKQIYGDQVPQELHISDDFLLQLQAHHPSPSPRWVDELWG